MRLIIGLMLAATLAAQVQTPLTIMQNSGTGTGELRMQERASNGQQYVGLKAPDSITTSVTWTLPNADGTAGRGLTTNGSGALAWSQVFLQGGNSFGADAVIGTNTSNSLQFETNGTLRWAIVPGGSLWAIADGAYDIGTSTNYRPSNVFITGTYTGANFAGAPAGTTGNYVSTRKLEIVDSLGGTGRWDVQASAVTSPSASSSLRIRDNSGVNVIEFVRASSGVALDYADVYVDLLPNSNLSQNLGASSQRWNNAFIGTLDVTTTKDLIPDATGRELGSISKPWFNLYADAFILVSDMTPDTNLGANIGNATFRFNQVFTSVLNASGAVTFPSGASITANGNAGVSVSGASCTIKRINYGIVTDATCP